MDIYNIILFTLFGWLYLNGRTERLNELFAIMMED